MLSFPLCILVLPALLNSISGWDPGDPLIQQPVVSLKNKKSLKMFFLLCRSCWGLLHPQVQTRKFLEECRYQTLSVKNNLQKLPYFWRHFPCGSFKTKWAVLTTAFFAHCVNKSATTNSKQLLLAEHYLILRSHGVLFLQVQFWKKNNRLIQGSVQLCWLNHKSNWVLDFDSERVKKHKKQSLVHPPTITKF